MRILILVMSFMLLGDFSAFAGVHVEPFVGYHVGEASDDESGASEDTYSYGSPVLGMRLGYGLAGISTGFQADYSAGTKWKQKAELASNRGDKIASKYSNYGIFVNVSAPNFIRAWVTYHYSSSVKISEGAFSGDSYKGNGFSLGLGATMIPLVGLNFEYRKLIYDEYEQSNGSSTNLSTEVSDHALVASVSLLLDL